jgi:hypothetical protein
MSVNNIKSRREFIIGERGLIIGENRVYRGR